MKESFKVNAKAVRFYLNYIRHYRHFEVCLAFADYDKLELDDVTCDRILDTIVVPLLNVSSEIYVYHNSRRIVKPVPKPPIPVWLAKHRTRLNIDPSKTSINQCRRFWRWVLRGKPGASGNLVIQIPITDFPKALIAHNCFNPAIITNLRAVVSPRAVSYCKRAIARGDSVCCAFHSNATGLHLSLFSNHRALSLLYRRCVKYGHFTMKGLEKELRASRSSSFKKRR